MTKEQFDGLKVTFKSKNDPSVNGPVNHEFTYDRMTEIKGDQDTLSLFKRCAMDKIKKERDYDARVIDSIKYQVLIDETSMIGEIKILDNYIKKLDVVETV